MPDSNSEVDMMPYEVSGDSPGIPIVLVPGGLSGWISWKPHAEYLSKRHRVVRVQLLNMAYAEKGEVPGPDYTLRTESEALGSTIDSIGIGRVNLVGWSHGGAVSLDFALNQPERVNTLTLIEPAAYWVGLAQGKFRDEVEQFAALFKSFHDPPTEEDLIGFLLMNHLVPQGADPRAAPRWPAWNSMKTSLLSIHTVLEHRDSARRLSRLRETPVLLVKGRDSVGFNSGGVDLIAEGIGRNAKVLVLPDGHACHIVAQDQFMAALEELVSGSDGSLRS